MNAVIFSVNDSVQSLAGKGIVVRVEGSLVTWTVNDSGRYFTFDTEKPHYTDPWRTEK